MNDMGTEDTVPETKVHKRTGKKNGWKWAFLSLVILIVGLSAAVIMKWIPLNFLGVTNTNTARVCSEDIVNRYNKLFVNERPDNLSDVDANNTAIKAIYAEIKARAGYESDPTCQTIIFWIALRDKDVDTASTSLARIRDLHSKSIFADSNLRIYVPLSNYEDNIEAVKSSDGPVNEEGLGQ